MSRNSNSGREAPKGVPFDAGAVAEQLAAGTAKAVGDLGRRGAVVAVSGGIDSSVTAALAAKGLGPENVLCLRLPERDVGHRSSDLGVVLAEALGTPTVEVPISGILEALGCYEARDEAIRKLFPDYEPDWKHKLVRSEPTGGMIVFSLVVEKPDGSQDKRRMPSESYRELLAATNMKQRTRKLLEYTWADRLHYAVIGTPNLLEYDQGFYVKGGDGLADVKPIASVYKSQVYAMATALGLPEEITSQRPTTDTFSLAQTQDEFYFGFPYEQMDLLMWGLEQGMSPEELAPQAGLEPDQVKAGYSEIERRRVATEYHAAPAVMVEPEA